MLSWDKSSQGPRFTAGREEQGVPGVLVLLSSLGLLHSVLAGLFTLALAGTHGRVPQGTGVWAGLKVPEQLWALCWHPFSVVTPLVLLPFSAGTPLVLSSL